MYHVTMPSDERINQERKKVQDKHGFRDDTTGIVSNMETKDIGLDAQAKHGAMMPRPRLTVSERSFRDLASTRESVKPTTATDPTKTGHNLGLSSSAEKLSNPTVLDCVGQVKMCREACRGLRH